MLEGNICIGIFTRTVHFFLAINGFYMLGKSQMIGDFTFLLTIPDFADVSDIRHRSLRDFPDYEFGRKWKVRQKSKLELKCERGTGAQHFRGLVMSEIHH